MMIHLRVMCAQNVYRTVGHAGFDCIGACLRRGESFMMMVRDLEMKASSLEMGYQCSCVM